MLFCINLEALRSRKLFSCFLNVYYPLDFTWGEEFFEFESFENVEKILVQIAE